jgi:hypothetical protein
MSQLVHALPRTFGLRRLVLAVVLSAGVATAGTLTLVSLLNPGHGSSSRGRAYMAPGHAFAIGYPAGWQALSQAKLRGVEGSPALVLRSADRRALVVVRQTAAPANERLSKLAAQLTADLKKRFADFKPVSARVARTRGGAAFLYTFARTRVGVVQSIMVTRVRGRAYSLYATAPAGQPGVAAQIGRILGTFGP